MSGDYRRCTNCHDLFDDDGRHDSLCDPCLHYPEIVHLLIGPCDHGRKMLESCEACGRLV